MKKDIYDVSLVEQGVFTWPSEDMKGWRNYRIEYGGHAESCDCEGTIWLPPHGDPEELENLFEKWQEEK